MTHATYNPFLSAASAAIAELSSDRAIYHYQRTAWAHAQRSVDDSIIVATYAIHSAIALYQLACGLADAVSYTESVMAVDDAPFMAEYPKYLPAPKAIAALPAVSSAPREAIVTPAPMTTPADVVDIIDGLIGAVVIADHEQAELDDDFSNMVAIAMDSTKAQLVKQCKALGLPASGTKRQLAERLAA